jgi:hypothetical protein
MKFTITYVETALYSVTVEAESKEEATKIFASRELPEGYCLGILNTQVESIEKL